MTSPSRRVLEYFRQKMEDAGYIAKYGYNRPDFEHYPKDKIVCELWLTDATNEHNENGEYPTRVSDNLECYVYRAANPQSDNGKWYDDIDEAVRALTHNHPDRANREGLYWDGETSRVDRTSPLKRWDNSMEYSAGSFCARIDLPLQVYPYHI